MPEEMYTGDLFLTEIFRTGTVWTLRNPDGFLTRRTVYRTWAPFWSTGRLATNFAAVDQTYQSFRAAPITVERWLATWLPGLQGDGIGVIVNWSVSDRHIRQYEPETIADQFGAYRRIVPTVLSRDAPPRDVIVSGVRPAAGSHRAELFGDPRSGAPSRT